MRESYRLLTEKGVECGLDLDGLLDVCDLTMDDLQVVGQQVNFPPARLSAFGPVWSFTEVERWLGPLPTRSSRRVLHLTERGLPRPST